MRKQQDGEITGDKSWAEWKLCQKEWASWPEGRAAGETSRGGSKCPQAEDQDTRMLLPEPIT